MVKPVPMMVKVWEILPTDSIKERYFQLLLKVNHYSSKLAEPHSSMAFHVQLDLMHLQGFLVPLEPSYTQQKKVYSQ